MSIQWTRAAFKIDAKNIIGLSQGPSHIRRTYNLTSHHMYNKHYIHICFPAFHAYDEHVCLIPLDYVCLFDYVCRALFLCWQQVLAGPILIQLAMDVLSQPCAF